MATKSKASKTIVDLTRKIEFEKEELSPFNDGYSVAKEEAYFSGMGEIAEDDPLYDRWIELIDRKERLERINAIKVERKGADSTLSRVEIAQIGDLGRLVDEGEDTMEIHTIEAGRMFMGRARSPGTNVAPIIGGKRVASSLRNLWLLTVSDNPLADWALVRHEQSMSNLQELLTAEIEKAEAEIGAPKHRGISFAIVRSEKPITLTLGFKSPYGYAVAALVAEFDYFVRLQKTLERKSLRTDDEVRSLVATITRRIRGVWNETERFDRWLNRAEVASLSRHDFIVAETDEAAAKRVQFVTEVFGVVPSQIFTGEFAPSHSRRRINITAQERKLIESFGTKLQAVEQEEAQAETAAEEHA